MSADYPRDAEPTWTLDRFRAAYAEDDNIWWVTGCGHHQNLFEDACDQLDALAATLARVEAQLAVVHRLLDIELKVDDVEYFAQRMRQEMRAAVLADPEGEQR